MQKINELSIPSGNQTHSCCNSDLWGKRGCEFTHGGSRANVGLGSTGRSVLLCAPGSAPAWPSLASALVQPWSQWDYGAHFWHWQWGVMAGREWQVQAETFGSFWDHEKSPSFRKAGNCGVWVHALFVNGADKGLNTEIVKEIPHEKHLPLLPMLDKKSSLFKTSNWPRDWCLTQGFKRTLQVQKLNDLI